RPVESYRLLRRYFQGGMRKNALAGRWFTRATGGTRGGTLIGSTGNIIIRTSKAGRPRLDGYSPFRVTSEDVKKIITGSVKYFYTQNGGNWRRAWLLTLSDGYIEVDFSSHIPLDKQVSKYTPDTYPSFEQYRY